MNARERCPESTLERLAAAVARVVGLHVGHRGTAERVVETIFDSVDPDQSTVPVAVFRAMLRTLRCIPAIPANPWTGEPAAVTALRGVPLESQVAAALACWEGFKTRELAAVLDCSHAEADAKLTRARDILRDRGRDPNHRARYATTAALMS